MEWCPQCRGKKQVPGRSESYNMFLYECPTCDGKGETTRERAKEWEDYEAAVWDSIFPPRPTK